MLTLPRLSPVRVNPVLRHPQEQRLALAGPWRFRLDPADEGLAAGWHERPHLITDPIEVPGCWQGQGYGHDGTDEVWDFRLQARTFRATYTGTGWYALSFACPPDWAERRVWLNFGGAHPSAQVWLNGRPLGENDLPFVPFGFEVGGLLRPGGDNDVVVRIHERHRLYGLAYNWQGNWSGLYRGVELTATGAGCLREVRLLPEVDGELVRVHAVTAGAEGGVLRITLSPYDADGADPSAAWEQPVTGELTAGAIPVPAPRLWSPDHPRLYRADVELVHGGTVQDALTERCGFLKLSHDGGHFLINDEPYYLRGSGDFVSCPETGCPDSDRERWRRKLRTLREYGYNQVRCQSYVYTPEYLEAADEVGLLVQSEMGMLGAWGSHTQWHIYAWPAPTPDHAPALRRQWNLTVRRDVNHPSAAIYCMSNELGSSTLFPRTAWRCYEETKALKPQALVLWTDGGYSPDLPGDFVNHNWPEGQPPPDRPLIEHEFRWWSSFPDVRLCERYTGAVRPYAAELARETARRRGQEHLLEAYAESSQRLQALEAKGKMEACRRDRPFLAGISHFNAMDANPSPQGILTEFYEPKLLDAASWRQTNGDTVVLSSLGFADRVLEGGGRLACGLFVSDFSHPPLAQPRLRWSLLEGATVLAAGTTPWTPEPFTTCPAGEVSAELPAVQRPRKLRLAAVLDEGEREFANSWDLWLFPAAVALPAGLARYGSAWRGWLADWEEVPATTAPQPGGLLLTEVLDETVRGYLQAGGRALLAAGEGLVRPHRPNFGYVQYFFTPPANYGPYEDGQNGTVVRAHPLLSDFPHEGFADLPFFRLIDNAPPLDLEPLGLHDEDPIIRVIHRYPVLHPLGYLVERSCGAGRLILSALELRPQWPEARYLLACFAGAGTAHPARPLEAGGYLESWEG